VCNSPHAPPRPTSQRIAAVDLSPAQPRSGAALASVPLAIGLLLASAKTNPRLLSVLRSTALCPACAYDEPIGELIAMVDGHSVDVDGSFQARVAAVQQVGDAAFVVLEEQGFWDTVSFTDFFTLAQIDGAWRIVNKTFTHTGGEPPATELA
jgi:hypothetical protein